MELTIVQKNTFNEMIEKVASLRDKFNVIINHKERGLEDWLDSQEVCSMLHISPRTLQTLRSNGSISFSQVGGKYFYHKDNVINLVQTKNKK